MKYTPLNTIFTYYIWYLKPVVETPPSVLQTYAPYVNENKTISVLICNHKVNIYKLLWTESLNSDGQQIHQ